MLFSNINLNNRSLIDFSEAQIFKFEFVFKLSTDYQ